MKVKKSINENVNGVYNSFRKTLETSIIDLCKQIIPDGGKINFIRPVIAYESKVKNNGGEFFSFMTETKVFNSIYWFDNSDYFSVDGVGYDTSSFLSPDSLMKVYNALCEVVRHTD